MVKEAGALHRAGYRVSIVTTFTDAALLHEDGALLDEGLGRYVAASDLTRGGWRRFLARAERRLATECVARLGIQSVRALGYGYGRHARQVASTDADLIICHQEMPTVIGAELLRRGRTVAFDFEDWYSEDLLPEARSRRPLRLLRGAEAYALAESPLTYTTSEAMATEMARKFDVSPPRVLRNVFPARDGHVLDGMTRDRRSTRRLSLHWYSQSVGPGRGLEDLCEALATIDVPYELHIRGRCSGAYQKELASRLDLSTDQDVVFHSLVPPRELLSRIAEHDVGLALESREPPSRDLTITNKIMQYLLAGLAILATPTRGQKEVADAAPGAVNLISSPSQLASAVRTWSHHPEDLQKAQYASAQAVSKTFRWELEEPRLVGWVDGVLGV